MRGREFAELRAFCEVARRRSFARAAEHLRIAPSTLSQTVRLLEERLGVVLLNRTTRRVSLTSAGERLLMRFAPAMSEMDAAVLEAHEGRTRPRGMVRLHAPRPAYERHIAPKLGLLQRSLPEVVLDLSVDDLPSEATAIGHDLIIRRGAMINSEWNTLTLGTDLRHVVVASPTYLSQREPPASPDDLCHHRCIQWRPGGGDAQPWVFEIDGQPRAFSVAGSLIVSHCEAAISAALQGVGVAYALEAYSVPHTATGNLISLLPTFLPTFDGWRVCYPSEPRPSPASLAVARVLSAPAM